MDFKLPNDQPLFSISAAAKLLDISVHTLRKYEREGLILPHKSEGNQRVYSKKDLERVSCIRKAIEEMKISINGIKSIYALIPCWNIIGCSDADRQSCDSYNGHSGACWSYHHPGTTCEDKDCRLCPVYTENYKCSQVKDLIKNISRNN